MFEFNTDDSIMSFLDIKRWLRDNNSLFHVSYYFTPIRTRFCREEEKKCCSFEERTKCNNNAAAPSCLGEIIRFERKSMS